MQEWGHQLEKQDYQSDNYGLSKKNSQNGSDRIIFVHGSAFGGGGTQSYVDGAYNQLGKIVSIAPWIHLWSKDCYDFSTAPVIGTKVPEL